jgi:hypothetical protein
VKSKAGLARSIAKLVAADPFDTEFRLALKRKGTRCTETLRFDALVVDASEAGRAIGVI